MLRASGSTDMALMPEIMTKEEREARSCKVLRFPPALAKGQLIRLTPDGPIHTVIGTNSCGALVKAGDWIDSDGNDLTDLHNAETISLHSFVYTAERGPNCEND